jgi:hypothetical protein
MRLPIVPTGTPNSRFYGEVVEFLRELAFPQGPTRVFGVDAAANLPSAADYNERAVYVRSVDVMVVSNGTAWIRQDTGAAI